MYLENEGKITKKKGELKTQIPLCRIKFHPEVFWVELFHINNKKTVSIILIREV